MQAALSKRSYLLFSAIAVILLSSVVLLSCYVYAHSFFLFSSPFVHMPLSTALCMLLSGIGLLCILQHQPKISLACGGAVLVFATVGVLQYFTTVDLAINQLLIHRSISIDSAHASHMSLLTALCFLLLAGILILLSSSHRNDVINTVLEVAACWLLVFSGIAIVAGIIAKFSSVAETSGVFVPMPYYSATFFIVLGLSFLTLVWDEDTQPRISGGFMVTVLLFILILCLDLLTPLGIALGVAYVPLILCSLKFDRENTALILATLATTCTVLGYFILSVDGTGNHNFIINRVLSLLAIWVTAIIIYQHKITQQKLQKSEEALALGWQGSGAGMWDWDIASHTTIYSDRYLELLGYSRGEIRSHFDEWSSRLHAEDKANTMALLDAHIKNNTPYETEYRLLHKSGEWRWFLTKGQASWDENGHAIRMAGSLSDINERKNNEIELRLLKLAVDYSKDVVLITDANIDNPVIVFASKAIYSISGYTAEEMIGKNPKILQGKDTDRCQLEALKTALNKNETFSGELLNYTKEGSEYWVDITIVPVANEQGVTTHFAAIERDVTDNKYSLLEREKLIAALEKSNQELDEFAYVASHDLKAPLRVIDNTSKWLEEDLQGKLDEESRENLDFLRNRVMRMEKLLDDLLAYSRIGRKLDASYAQTVTGDILVSDICDLINTNNAFKVVASPDFKQLHVKRMPLHQILLNLINNAIKHHDKSMGKIHISVEKLQDHYVISVADDGPGIPDQYHEQIFKMFQTLRPRDQVEGSGMGLAVVRKYIQHFGGEIWLQPNKARGSTFSFTWPIIQN